MNAMNTILAFDIGTTLGLGTPCDNPIEGHEGVVVLRVPAGISLISLRDSKIGQELFFKHESALIWNKQYKWIDKPVEPGVYHLRLPIQHSNGKTYEEQKLLLLEGETIAPLALIALALFCLKKTDQPDPLQGGCTNGLETICDGSLVSLVWADEMLVVSLRYDGSRHDGKWLTSCRKIS